MNSNIRGRYRKEGYCLQSFCQTSLVRSIKRIIEEHFDQTITDYCLMGSDEYRSIVAECQDEINSLNIAEKLVFQEKKIISQFMISPFLLQSRVFLRATRPSKEQIQEYVGYHRESFYSDVEHKHIVDQGMTIWVPIKNVNYRNTLNFIPRSHTIPSTEIKLQPQSEDKSSVKKGSSGHKIGLLYSPKEIIGGVDLTTGVRFDASVGSYIVFSNQLIHGNGINNAEDIRFSIDFNILPHSDKTPVHIPSDFECFSI